MPEEPIEQTDEHKSRIELEARDKKRLETFIELKNHAVQDRKVLGKQFVI